jgi:outer membrane protein assembly factor BamA
MFDIIYTTEKQFILDVIPKIYFNFGNLFFDGSFKYKVFPNSFWGIGNNTPDENLERYNMRSVILKAALLQRLPPDLNFGFQYQYEHHTILELDSAGQLISEDIPGSSGATINGLSFIFNLDNRDNIFSTRSGNFMQLTAGFSAKGIGATHSYNKYIIDLRKYFSIKKKSSIATQIYYESTFGDVPFQTKALLGGGERMRGFFRGRYIDDHMYVVQAEYRNRFAKRWIVAAFGALGEVASLPREFMNDVKYSLGGGIRFQIIKANQTLLRLDFGYGKGGNSGVYFGVNEAF